MFDNYSERYKKALVTVAMGLRTEDDIQKKGVYRFTHSQKTRFIKLVKNMFDTGGNVLILKIKQFGYRSEHLLIKTADDLQKFLSENLDDAFKNSYELWVLKTSSENCYRCRLYLKSNIGEDIFEAIYSNDDHALDHISNDFKGYARFKIQKNEEIITERNGLTVGQLDEVKNIIKNLYISFDEQFKMIREDLPILQLDGISLDVRVNKDGYDFHDFDVPYSKVKDVVNYYVGIYMETNRGKKC